MWVLTRIATTKTSQSMPELPKPSRDEALARGAVAARTKEMVGCIVVGLGGGIHLESLPNAPGRAQ